MHPSPARLGVDSRRVGSEGNIKWQQDGEGETAPPRIGPESPRVGSIWERA